MSESERVLELDHRFKCRHNKFLIDTKLNYVECGLCGEQLNPMWVLSELANRESRAVNHLAHLEAQIEKAKNRIKCKCQHCSKMTYIVK